VTKKSVVEVLSTLPGFRNVGGFHIGLCNPQVISGYAVDAPPGGIYVWRFILPVYDRVEFLHMSLGKRIARFSGSQTNSSLTDLELLLANDWQGFSSVRDCQSLLSYLDRERVEGEYGEWTRYLTYVRVGDLNSATRLQLQWQSSSAPPPNLQMVQEAKARSGWNGVQELLTEWSEHTLTKFCR
jgi:hypothetical protein